MHAGDGSTIRFILDAARRCSSSQEVRTQGGGDAQGARARRIVDGARRERTFEFAIEVYAFRVAFVLLLTRRLARSV